MATEEELNREKELNNVLNERVGINEKLVSDQQDIANVILDQVKGIEFAKIEQTKLRSITRDLAKTAQDNYAVTLQELGTKQLTDKLQKDSVKIQNHINNLKQIQVKELTKDKELQKAIQDSLDYQVGRAEALKKETEQLAKESENIKNNFGVDAFQGFSGLAQKIPGLGKFSKEFADAADKSRISAAKGGKNMKAFGAGLNSALKSIGPLLILTQVIKAFTQLDKGAGEIGKQLGISYEQSAALQSSLTKTASVSGDIPKYLL